MTEKQRIELEDQIDEHVHIDNPDEISKEEIQHENDELCQWIVLQKNKYYPSGEIILADKVKPGNYSIRYDSNKNSYFLCKQSLYLDELLHLPIQEFNMILEDLNFFWKSEHLFKKYKYAYKRGILLYGEPGCGKTSLCALLSKMIEDLGGIIFLLKDTDDLSNYMEFIPQIFRRIEPNTPILTIIEDLDGILSNGAETKLLNMLDGFNQFNNIVNIGCTNYPEKLKERILNRPSRFDKRYHIGLPVAEVREYYFQHKIHPDDLNEKILKNLVAKTEGLSIAHLGELIKSVFIFGKDIDESVKELKEMSKYISSSSSSISGNGTIGFKSKINESFHGEISVPRKWQDGNK